MIRVALLKGDYDAAGGPETLLASLIPHLRAAGVDPLVVILARDPHHRLIGMLSADPSIPVRVIPWRGLARAPATAAQFARLVREEACEVIHTHDMRSCLTAVLAKPVCRLPWLAHVHGWLGPTHRGVHALYEKIDRRLVRLADAVAVGSRDTQAEVTAQGVARIAYVPNAVNFPRHFDAGAASVHIRERFGVKANDILLGMVGRLQYGKGQDLFIRAVAALVARGRPVKALIAGDGAERDRLQSLVTHLGLGGIVHLTGFVEDLQSHLLAMDAVAVPSRKESLPLTALEAMALARPVVAARVGDLADVINDGINGILVPPEDADALAGALLRLTDDAGLRRQLGEAGRRRIAEAYSMPGMARQLESVYAGLLAG